MDDERIVGMFWQRDEAAIAETKKKYGKYCFSIADRILNDREDAMECVNDAYLGAWNSIPPHKPEVLSTFLGKITRRIALKMYRARSAQKRGGGEACVSFDELEECIPSGQAIDERLEEAELVKIIDSFLEGLTTTERRVFLRRYWFFDSVSDISKRYGFGSSKVKMILKRTRDKLRVRLKDEGILL